MKEMKNVRPTCVRSVQINTCRQKEKTLEKNAYRGRKWKMMRKEPYLRGMWEYVLQERIKVKRFRELADEEKQAGIQGQRQQASQRVPGTSEMLP